MSRIKKVIFVQKQGIEHFESMILWLHTNVGTGNFRWFGCDISYYNNHDVFHFYNEEAAVAFKLVWNGKSYDTARKT